MNRFYLVFGFLLSTIFSLAQPCRVSPNIEIPDNGRTYPSRIEANTSNSGHQVLCGVRLSFTHQFADELRFVLQSPDGKRLVLKAGKTASSKTSGSTFDIFFVRGNEEAHPDDFKKPVWKDNKWEENQAYVGSYYPDGEEGLAHFDGERLTGSWNLLYTDRVSGGKGILHSFELIFCDAPVFCNPCSVPRDFVNAQNFGSFCGGDPTLSTIRPSFISSRLQPGYSNTFLIVNSRDKIISRGSNPDLSSLNSGTYTIVGLQFRNENSSQIESINDMDDLNELFYGNQARICGAISNTSATITILSDPGFQQETLEVYGKDQIILDGRVITSDQTVEQRYTDQNGCDSLVRINVQFKEYEPDFMQDHLYDCDHTTIQLKVTTEQGFGVQRWFTSDGKISNQSDISSDQIMVNAPGTYFVVFEIADYLDTVPYTLRIDPATPVLSLSNEYVLCSSTPLVLPIGSNFSSATVNPATSASIRDGFITFQEPDLYTVSVSNGACPITKHILVKPPVPGEIITIENAAISCPDNPVEVTPDLTREYQNYAWYLDGTEVATTKTLSTTEPGFYSFRAFDGNQCGSSGTVLVEDNISSVNLEIEGTSIINCSNEGMDNRLSVGFTGDFNAQWNLPDGTTSSDLSVPINGEGEYTVGITDESGCTFSESHTVTSDFTEIDFEVEDDVVIKCDLYFEPINATVEASPDEYDISWTGATQGNPSHYAIVSEPGTVSVTVTHKRSQCSTTKSVTVTEEAGKPQLEYDGMLARAITCVDPIRKIPISISDCDGCTPELHPENGFQIQDDTLIATKPGTVSIKLENENCVSEHEIIFPDQKEAEKLDIVKQNIGCNDKAGRIEIQNHKAYSSLRYVIGSDTLPYTGPITNIDSPQSYLFLYTQSENGCTSKENVTIQESMAPPKIEYDPIQYLDCNTGVAKLKFTGTGIEQVRWLDSENNEISNDRQIEVDQAGEYRLVVYNAIDCYQDVTIQVVDDRSSPSLDLDPEYVLPCSDSEGSISLSYDTSKLASTEWYGAAGLISSEFYPDLEAGNYQVLIEGKNGCKTTEQTSVVQQVAGAGPEVIAPAITCNRDFSTVHLESYQDVQQVQWIDESGQASSSDTFDVYNPGRISLTIRLTNGCLVSKSLSVEDDKATVPFTLNKPIINCHTPDPKFVVKNTDTTNRKINYQWYFGKTPVGNEPEYDIDYPGNYKVDVFYDNGCLDSLTHTVRLDTSAIEFRLRTDTITCARSKIQLRSDIMTDHITSASWTGPEGYTSKAIRPNFQLPGTYEVTYAGENGCKGTETMEIYGDIHAPEVDSVDYPSLGCDDKEVDLTFFTDDSVTIQYWQSPDGQILEDAVVKVRSKGNYTLYLEGSNGCSKIDTFFIDGTIIPHFDVEVEAAGCDDQTGTALILPERDTFEAIWYEPGTGNELGRGHRSPELGTGSYLVTVINPYNNCDSTAVFEISDISSEIAVDISIDDSIRCERSQANLMASVYPPSEHYVYEWRYGSEAGVISTDSMATGVSRLGQYSLIARDTVNQCMVEGRYHNVRAPSRLRYFDMFLTEPACDINRAGWAIMDSLIGASDMSLVTYSLNGGPYREQDTFPFLYANERYDISAKDQYGCRLDTTLLPELRGIMDRVALIPDTTINSGDSINFNDPAFKIQYVSADAPLSEQYTWILNPDTLSCDYDCVDKIQKQLFETRTISARMTNQYGCVITDTFVVHVREGDVLNVPNAIAPTSGNVGSANACIYANQYVEVVELFVVFNRQGNVIFKSSGFNPENPYQQLPNCWNGLDSQNNPHPPGNYNYYVKYRTVYGESRQKYGNILLIR